MNKESELLRISNLIDVYGSLLTNKQLTYIKMYYFDDLSLNEIADDFSVSKNAVYDSITKSINNLENIDKKLKLISKREKRKKIYESLNDKDLKEKLMKIDELI